MDTSVLKGSWGQAATGEASSEGKLEAMYIVSKQVLKGSWRLWQKYKGSSEGKLEALTQFRVTGLWGRLNFVSVGRLDAAPFSQPT